MIVAVGFAASIFLIVVGAILRFRYDFEYFVDYHLVGVIFMSLGVAGFVLSILLRHSWSGGPFSWGEPTADRLRPHPPERSD